MDIILFYDSGKFNIGFTASGIDIPLSMEISRQDYRSGLPFPSPGVLPDPGIEPGPPVL